MIIYIYIYTHTYMHSIYIYIYTHVSTHHGGPHFEAPQWSFLIVKVASFAHQNTACILDISRLCYPNHTPTSSWGLTTFRNTHPLKHVLGCKSASHCLWLNLCPHASTPYVMPHRAMPSRTTAWHGLA